jgi:hypothetical protein
MQFDPALAAQQAFCRADTDNELGADRDEAVETEVTFSSNAGVTAREAYEGLLAIARRYPLAHSFQAFCSYITWQQVTEETIARHFQTGLRLCETFLASPDGKHHADVEQITELYGSFRNGLGLDEEDEIQVEFRRDTPKGGD